MSGGHVCHQPTGGCHLVLCFPILKSVELCGRQLGAEKVLILAACPSSELLSPELQGQNRKPHAPHWPHSGVRSTLLPFALPGTILNPDRRQLCV
jgi:hypothetical protein